MPSIVSRSAPEVTRKKGDKKDCLVSQRRMNTGNPQKLLELGVSVLLKSEVATSLTESKQEVYDIFKVLTRLIYPQSDVA